MYIYEMSLKEKVSLLSGRGNWFFRGIKRFEIDDILVCDGPHGLRKKIEPGRTEEYENSRPATCFPAACTLASSWDRDLVKKVGRAIAAEARAEDVSVVLGPGANIKRSPLCGRNFEYFSEDPYISGELAAAMISAIQAEGIGCSLKHFAVNNQERYRMTIDAVVDQRALHEIYLAGFEKAIKTAKPWTVMCAYNRINGDYACENHFLLTEKLRNEWKFEGIVISDWGACNNRTDSITAGLDIEMPDSGPDNPESVAAAVEQGRLTEDIVNLSVERIIKTLLKAAKRPGFGKTSPGNIDYEEHHRIAREAAAESIILLKNSAGALPLRPEDQIAVIGEFAENPRYQGAGSSRINPVRLDTFLAQIRADYPEATYAKGYSADRSTADQRLIDEAVKAASAADKIIILAGLPDSFESEGFDRPDMKLPESHNRLVETLTAAGKPVVVCLCNGSPVEMPWAAKASAIVECYLGGQAGGAALTDVLTGRVNPSGRLAETFPAKVEDNPSHTRFPGGPRQVEYRESIYVGYRYYDTAGVKVLFPFGHGLSYTSFEYSGMTVDRTKLNNQDRRSFNVTVSASIKNTGSLEGKEVVQLYISAPASAVHRPVKELKDFQKVNLTPGADGRVSFTLNFRSFACFNQLTGEWMVPPGCYEIMLGSSSAAIRLRHEIEVTGPETFSIDTAAGSSDYIRLKNNAEIIHSISDQSFSRELGYNIPENKLPDRFERTTTLEHFSRSLPGKILMRYALKEAAKNSSEIENSAGMYENMAREMPLRALAQFSNEAIDIAMVDALILIVNKQLLRARRALNSKTTKGI